MALALGLKVGSKFYLNDTEVRVLEMHNYESAKISIEGKEFNITDQAAVEVMPNVMVSCGRPSKGRLDMYLRLMGLHAKEQQRRDQDLKDGRLTQSEYEALEPLVVPYEFLPRLIIDAPKDVVILREELYRKSK